MIDLLEDSGFSQGFLGDGEKSRISDCQKIKEPIYPLLIFSL
jgi:hypothetical protein